MLDILKQDLEEIKKSQEFKEWKDKHSKAYLCGAFLDKNWQIDFYDPNTDKITTFHIDNKVLFEEGEVFKSKHKIKELNLNKVKIDLEKALDIIKKLIDEKYNHQEETNKIIILQHLDRQVWNITYVMRSLSILNVKIDAETGKIIHEDYGQLLSFKK